MGEACWPLREQCLKVRQSTDRVIHLGGAQHHLTQTHLESWSLPIQLLDKWCSWIRSTPELPQEYTILCLGQVDRAVQYLQSVSSDVQSDPSSILWQSYLPDQHNNSFQFHSQNSSDSLSLPTAFLRFSIIHKPESSFTSCQSLITRTYLFVSELRVKPTVRLRWSPSGYSRRNSFNFNSSHNSGLNGLLRQSSKSEVSVIFLGQWVHLVGQWIETVARAGSWWSSLDPNVRLGSWEMVVDWGSRCGRDAKLTSLKTPRKIMRPEKRSWRLWLIKEYAHVSMDLIKSRL